MAMIHKKKAFWGTKFAGYLKVHRAGQDPSFADFEAGELAEVSEETSGYIGVFEHHFLKVMQSKCRRKCVLKLDWKDRPRDVKRQVQAT
jgi:hypothetical protein